MSGDSPERFRALIHSAGHYLNWTENNKDYMAVKIVSVFRTAVPFFLTCQALKHGSSYRWQIYMEIIDHDLKGNKNYFELAEDSSYRGFELPRVK